MNAESNDADVKPYLPWLSAETKRTIAYIQQITNVRKLTLHGIMGALGQPQLIRALNDYDLLVAPDSSAIEAELEARLANAELIASFAKTEADSGFPTVNSHAAVGLWGALEAWIEDIALAAIRADRQYRTHQAFSAVTISVAEYELMDDLDRSALLARELQRVTKSNHLPGVARFEVILSVFGLGGAVQQDVRRDLLELSKIRNVIVHRTSLVDEALLTACPWLNVPRGERLKISNADFDRYESACGRYLTEVIVRALPESARTALLGNSDVQPSTEAVPT